MAGRPAPGPAKSLLDPKKSVLILIDYQPQMFFGVASMDRQTLINNTVGLAKGAQAFKVPTILSTVETKAFSGPFLEEITSACPDNIPVERTSMNAWEDKAFVEAVAKTGRSQLVIAALWTEVCLAMPVLCALEQGLEVYPVVDASGGTTAEAHDIAVQRMVQKGAQPVSWLQVVLEWQRDWARKGTYDAVVRIVRQHGGAYGQGIEYAAQMVHGKTKN